MIHVGEWVRESTDLRAILREVRSEPFIWEPPLQGSTE
jgi:hypothetical protein